MVAAPHLVMYFVGLVASLSSSSRFTFLEEGATVYVAAVIVSVLVTIVVVLEKSKSAPLKLQWLDRIAKGWKRIRGGC